MNMFDELKETLEEKIMKAQPHKDWYITSMGGDGEEYSDDLPITLEDVLIAFKPKITNKFIQDFELEYFILRLFSLWQLGKPLDNQTPKTIEFLNNLID